MASQNAVTLRRRLLMCSAMAPALSMAPIPAVANPSGPSIIAGHVMIGPGGNILMVKQFSQRAVINWQSFSIAGGETTRFNLPSSTAAVLNRVTGTQLSALLGNLYSNGQVYLLNPNGIVIGRNGRVRTGGFIASTLDIDNQQFMQGGAQALQGDSAAGVAVLGTVKATSGDVLLVAAQVDNAGKLIAPNGEAILAAGSQVLYVPGDGDSNIAIEAPSPAPANGGAAVSNNGLIKAAGVQLAAAGSAYALAVNNGGMISAASVQHVGGRVILSGGDGDVMTGGTIDAAGGTVTLTGGRVALTGHAAVNVAAPNGGGSVTLAASNAIAVTAGATIDANATANGNGGHISIKAEKATQFAGTATATGGPQGGNGGNAEISGGTLSYTGSVDLRAPYGTTGTLLFDPTNIDVVSGDAAAPSDLTGGLWGFTQDVNQTQISVGAIESLLQSSNLELQASNSLTFDAPTGSGSFVTLSSNTANTLTLTAPTIAINASISLPNGKLVFNWPDADVITFSTTAQSVSSAASATITAGTLQIAGNYSSASLNGAVTTGSLEFTEPNFNAFSVTINNAANAISAVSLDPSGSNSAQSMDIESSSAMALSGNLGNYGTATFVAGGDLTLQSGFALTSGATTTLASTGGVLNNLAGSNAYSSANGTLRIYSSTNGTGTSGTTYNANGIANGAPTESGVTYPQNPDTFDAVVAYFATTSSLPTLTITANSFSRYYGQPDPTFTASYSGGSGGGARELTTQPFFRILQGSDINAGSYTIQPYGAASAEDLLAYVNGTLIVNPAVLTIAANPSSMTYGGTLPTFSADISGFVNGDSSSLVSGLTVGSNATAAPQAGSYTITPSGAVVATPPGGVEPNYTISYQTNTLTVNKAPLSVSAVAASANYGSAVPNFQLNFSGFVDEADTVNVAPEFQAVTTAVQGSSVGNYPITLVNANINNNYSVTYTGANFIIDPVPLLITPDVSRLYGGSLPSILPASDFSGLVNGDTPSSLTTQPTLTTIATITSGVGHYGITASGAADLNYGISYAPGTLAITPAPLLITPNNESLTYGSTNPSFSGASYSGLLNGDTSSVVSGLTISTSAVIQAAIGVTPYLASPVGTYQLTGSGASAANYTISYAPGMLTITPAPLSIQPSGTSTYGQSPTTGADVTYNAVGFVNGDTLASLTTQPSYRTSATNTSAAGPESLLAYGAADPNYTITYQPGVLTVNPATLTLAPDPINISYGLPGPQTDTYTVSGLVNGDTLNTVFGSTMGISVNVPSVTGQPAGAYQMFVQTPRSIDDNYLVNTPYVPLTVVPAGLVIATTSYIVTGNESTPTLTGTFYGLVNGDTPASSGFGFKLATLPSAITGNSTVFPIELTGSNPNYTVTYQAGTVAYSSAVTTPIPTSTVNSSTNFVETSLDTSSTSTRIGTVTTQIDNNIQTTAPSNTSVTLFYSPLGLTGPATQVEQDVISAFLATTTDGDTPATEALMQADLLNPNTRDLMLSDLLKFYTAELEILIGEPQSDWTTAQAGFVQQFENFLQQQRQDAAEQAEADYQAWTQQQEAQTAQQYGGQGSPELTEASAVLSTSPPVPPSTFLAEVQTGMMLSSDQAADTIDIVANAPDFSQSSTSTTPSTTQGSTSAGTTATTVVRTAGQTTDVAAPLLPFGGINVLGLSKTTKQAAQETGKASEALKNSGTKVNVALKTRAPDINIAENAEQITSDLNDAVKSGKLSATSAQQALSIVSKAADGAELTADDIAVVTKALSAASKVMEAAGAVAGPAGIVVEIIAAVMQTGAAAASYAEIGDYNTAFNTAVNAANQPVTVSTLQGLSSTQLATSIAAMMSTSYSLAPQADKPTWPLTDIENPTF
jgi:filamentous hemagglutinin family protein